jgi:hypothetical protein
VTIPAAPPISAPTEPELVRAVMDALAEVRGCAIGDLDEEMRLGGGELEMESPEAVAVISKVEGRYGGRRLARVEDLEPEELTSVGVLAGLLHRRWPADARDGGDDGEEG